MKQVNFKELNTEVKIGEFETIDLRHEIGNAVHRQAVNIPMSELAKAIYYSDEPVCMDEKDYIALLDIIEKSFAVLVLQAVRNSTEEEKEVQHD